MEKYILTSKRLTLVPFIPEDAKEFQLLNNDSNIRKYLWDNEEVDAITVDDIMDKSIVHFEEDQYGLWRIQLRNNGPAIGYAGLWPFFEEPQPQLVCALQYPFTKKGYATEASTAIMDYAFEQLGFNHLIGATEESHFASQRVAIKLGMVLVEKRMEHHRPILVYRRDKRDTIIRSA
ncbi:MAG: GNAT family N-acetyltransferase [Bacteroidota bacterium]